MPTERARRAPIFFAPLLLWCGVALAGCGTPPSAFAQDAAAAAQQMPPSVPMAAEPPPSAEAPAPAPASAPADTTHAAPAAAPSAPAPASAMPVAPAAPDPVLALLVFAERARTLSAADRAREIGATGAEAASPQRQLRLALLLMQPRAPSADLARAQQLLQQVSDNSQPNALLLRPLARLLAVRLVEQRRLEDQIDRLNQQLRDQQRRIDQLNQRLEAVRAIERSMMPRPPPSAVPLPHTPAAAPAPPPAEQQQQQQQQQQRAP